MNCVGKWCRERCYRKTDCSVCTAECPPRIRLHEAVKVSEHLIWILQNQNGAMTHPIIADRIADYIGATPEERDAIVHPSHRGTYKAKDSKRRFGVAHSMWGGTNSTEIVAIKRNGDIAVRYPSARAAARAVERTPTTIRNRCIRKGISDDEFIPPGITFRFAAEWDAMSEEERANDLRQPEIGK